MPFKPFVSAETLKACALIGLHLLAAEDEAGSSGGQSSDSGDVQKSTEWNSDVESWSESGGISSSERCEHNVDKALLRMSWGRTGQVNICLSSWKVGNLRGWP